MVYTIRGFMSVSLVLMVIAFILFALKALGVQSKVDLVAAGLALWLLATMI